MSGLDQRLRALDWDGLAQALNGEGHAVTPPLLDRAACGDMAALYEDCGRFRATVVMARHGFGRGEYRYFADPLPEAVAALRSALYPPLAAIANDWEARLGHPRRWPLDHGALLALCAEHGQTRPTPLLLRYGAGDYNCLHQDLYGEIVFPLQVVVMLDEPERDFTGGALVLVETRPRQQSRCETVLWRQGQAAIIPVRERPRAGSRGDLRTPVRHGVSTVHSGLRRTLGVIFHNAA